jgi:endoglucanase
MSMNLFVRVIGASAMIALMVGGTRLALGSSQENAGLGTQSRVSGGAASRGVKLDKHILVDQFGYRPADSKVAVIRDPVRGYDAGDRFSPGSIYQVRRADDGAVAFEGKPVVWNHGEVEASSGDRGWWFDFSQVTTPGAYFVFDKSNEVRSATFSVDQSVYKDVLKATARMYFYQRNGFAKAPPYAERCWQDAAAYLGANQDSQAHDVTDRANPSKVKDLSGGWFDAGDTNKYVKNALRPVHQLLNAFQENPQAFTDDFNIPESGNLIPDLLDELDWELAWLKKMQYPDGSAALKVGALTFARASPPSSDSSPRFYVPSCSSATIGVAGMFAHAAVVYRGIPQLAGKGQDLQGRAIKAWDKFRSTSSRDTQCDSGEVKVPGADLPAEEQDREAVVAAIYLYALTEGVPYHEFIKQHYRELRPYHDMGWSRYDPEQGQSLLFYTTLPHADAALKGQIVSDLRNHVSSGNQIYGTDPADLYRNFLHDGQYHWGSNEVRADYGNSNMEAVLHGAAGHDVAPFVARALDTLHYFHGVNPFGKVYLSNMYEYGATTSVNEIFHAWYLPKCNQLFCSKTPWDNAVESECGPAPGFLPGGPVANIVTAGIPASLMPPAGQPPQKSYAESNRDNPDKAYVFNEPSIVYQAAYLQLLSKFVN